MEVNMRLLFDMDKKDYENCSSIFVRNSARSIIIKNSKVAMIHSLKYDYYKFPGGGIEDGERPIDALLRETCEESGLIVIPETIKEYGYVHRIQKSDKNDNECFVQDNYYYMCDVSSQIISQKLNEYEAEEHFTLEYIAPMVAIEKNKLVVNSPYDKIMFEREARVLEILIDEGYLV